MRLLLVVLWQQLEVERHPSAPPSITHPAQPHYQPRPGTWAAAMAGPLPPSLEDFPDLGLGGKVRTTTTEEEEEEEEEESRI